MGILKLNDISYSGSGSAKQTPLTQAEYDALVRAGTVDPTTEYFITDGIPEGDHLHITLTQAEYDALVQAGTVDPNAFYFIEDGSPSAYTEKVLYTNVDEDNWVSQADGTVITLSDDITQFDEIRFEGAFFETYNDTGHKLTHFSSVKIPKTTIINCLNNYADSDTNPLQWQAIVDAPCTILWSNNQFYSYGFSLKIPTTTSVLVKTRHVIGWAATQCGITKIVGINYDVVGGGTHQYSTEEQVVGKWIDGSPVYEKTFVINNPSTDNNTITHNISNLDMLISVSGFAKRADGYQQPFNFISNADDFKWNLLVLDFGSTDFVLQVGASYTSTRAISKAVVILRYTKSSS